MVGWLVFESLYSCAESFILVQVGGWLADSLRLPRQNGLKSSLWSRASDSYGNLTQIYRHPRIQTRFLTEAKHSGRQLWTWIYKGRENKKFGSTLCPDMAFPVLSLWHLLCYVRNSVGISDIVAMAQEEPFSTSKLLYLKQTRLYTTFHKKLKD